MKGFLKELFFRIAPHSRLGSKRAVILMYHSISAYDHFTTVSPHAFEAQMQYLAEQHIPVISLDELTRRLGRKEPLGGAAVITFDDGYRDNAAIALPILRRHSFPATIFVETDCIGWCEEGIQYLSADELRELSGDPLISLQPHTESHPHLSQLPAAEARAEMAGSKQVLENIRGTSCRHIAYPYGDYAPETVALAREIGYESAVTVREGTVGPESKLLELPRVSIDRSTTPAQFRGKISRAVDWYERLKL